MVLLAFLLPPTPVDWNVRDPLHTYFISLSLLTESQNLFLFQSTPTQVIRKAQELILTCLELFKNHSQFSLL